MSFVSKIKNVIRWINVIIKDRDYDYNFLLRILEFKLRNMQSFFESDKTHTIAAIKTSAEIKLVADALARYREDSYCLEMYSALERHHGKIEMKFKPYDEEYDEFDGFYFTNSNNQEYAIDLWSRINERAEDLKRIDLEFAFDTIKGKILDWWD